MKTFDEKSKTSEKKAKTFEEKAKTFEEKSKAFQEKSQTFPCRILVIGDLHFKINNTEDSHDVIKDILEKSRELKPDKIVLLGDTLDKHSVIHLLPLKRSIDFIGELSEISPVYLIIGNHDRPNPRVFMTDDHPFTALKRWKNVKVVEKTLVEYPFVYVPYVPVGRFLEALQGVDMKRVQCIFAHQEFRGSVLDTQGDEWPKDYPLVISGHIHHHKIMDNIFYTGTPVQHSFYEPPENFIFLFSFPPVENGKITVDYIPTRTRKKVLLKTTTEDFMKVYEEISEEDPNEYLIVVHGYPRAFDVIPKKNVKIQPKIKESKRENPSPIKNFMDRLEEKIKDDPECKEWLKKLSQ